MRRLALLAVGTGAMAACVPADEAIGLGSVQFLIRASVPASGVETTDKGSVRVDRVVLGFKTMTLGRVGTSDCAFRGRAADRDVVFDPRFQLTQTFNGIEPAECPDVGIILGPPSAETLLGPGATSSDLVDLASGTPAHAIVEATATRIVSSLMGELDRPTFETETVRIVLRFDPETTSSRFGSCGDGELGLRVVASSRNVVPVRFSVDLFFRTGLSLEHPLRVSPFFEADADRDGVVTLEELDGLALARAPSRFDEYRLPDGSRTGSFGDYLRLLFRFAFRFGDGNGSCLGHDPGFEGP